MWEEEEANYVRKMVFDPRAGQKDEDFSCKDQRQRSGGRCRWFQQQRKTPPPNMFASRAFPTLGVLQATEVTGAPWGEEKSRLENCMRRAVGVAGSLGTPA